MKTPSDRAVRAWDLPTRLAKWLLAVLVLSAWASNKYGGAIPSWHVWNGYAVLVVFVFRVLWGFFGGSTARFSSFVSSPRAAIDYLRAQAMGRARRYLGHNPLGAWMVLALLAAVAAQACLGLYAADEDRLIIEGPLARTVSDASVEFAAHWHHVGFNVILGLVAIHVAANLAYDLIGRYGLISAMLTGRKTQRHDYEDMHEAKAGSPGAALVCLVAAVFFVFGGIFALGGNPFR